MINKRFSLKPPSERVLEIVSGDFPLESRLAEYALGLLELNQLGRMLIEVVFSILPPPSAIGLAALFKGEEDFQRLEENLAEAEDANDLGRAFAVFLGAPSSRKAQRFSKAIRPLLKRQIKPDRASYRRRVEQLCRKLNLDAEGISLFELGCCYTLNHGLECLLDSLQFKQLTWRQRESIWLTQLRKHRIKRFFQTSEIQKLAKRFPVSPGLIACSVKTVKQCRTPDMSASQVHAMLDEVLTRQMELTEGVKPEKKLNDINENYDPVALNTDANIPRLLQGLSTFRTLEAGYGMNLLFWGWPGTGKTEFGKYIAERLGKELLVKRMSDLQSKWVGETEKQIAVAFREAEENDAILFLDEADSLFINRQTANRSWETSQTNEILTQMENFSGILICCTNLLENLDEAAMRRFAFKIKFLPLTEEGTLRLFRKYFQALKGALTPEQEARLSNVRNLCPGDIKAVWQRLRFMGDSLTHGEVIHELKKEVSYKKGGNKVAIGF